MLPNLIICSSGLTKFYFLLTLLSLMCCISLCAYFFKFIECSLYDVFSFFLEPPYKFTPVLQLRNLRLGEGHE